MTVKRLWNQCVAICFGLLFLAACASVASATLTKMSSGEMQGVTGGDVWCCNVTSASQHMVCRALGCTKNTDFTNYPCILSYRYVATSAKECQTCANGTSAETMYRACQQMLCYTSAANCTCAQAQNSPLDSVTCYSCP